MAGILLPHAGRDPQCGRHLGRHPRGRCRPQCARCRPRCRPQCARQRPTRQFPYGRSIPPWSAFRACRFLMVFTVLCAFLSFLGVLWAAGRPKVLQKGEDGAYLPATWVSNWPNWPQASSKNGRRSRKTGSFLCCFSGFGPAKFFCAAKTAPTFPYHGQARRRTSPNLALRGANRAPRWSNKKPKIWQDVSANIKFHIYIGFFLYVCMYVRMHKSSKDNAGQVRGTSDANLSSSLPGV